MQPRGEDKDVFVIGSNLMWSVWKCRCKWVFERTPFSMDIIKAADTASLLYLISAGQDALVRTEEDSAQQIIKKGF